MMTYPIMLNMRGRLAVVVGAGEVGLRKVRSLLETQAKVRLVCSQLPASADELRRTGVEILREPYRAEHLRGAALVFACTDNATINHQVAADARTAIAMVNVADDPEHCDFFAPALIRRGEVVIALGTGGASPALAAELSNRIARTLPENVGEFAGVLANLRKQVLSTNLSLAARSEILRHLAGEEGYQAFARGGSGELAAMARELLKKAANE